MEKCWPSARLRAYSPTASAHARDANRREACAYMALGPTRLPGAHSEPPDYLEAHPRMGLEWAEQTRGKNMRRGTLRTHVPVPHSPTASVLARDAGRREAWDKAKSVENAVTDIKKCPKTR